MPVPVFQLVQNGVWLREELEVPCQCITALWIVWLREELVD